MVGSMHMRGFENLSPFVGEGLTLNFNALYEIGF